MARAGRRQVCLRARSALAGGAACAVVAVLAFPVTAAAATDQQQIVDLRTEVHDLHDFVQFMFLPMGVLLAVLTIGGALSVVFSIRDQRRVSQLHELAVTGEVSGQRRSEQSFSSFLEESQKTLTLVNDTLKLAKEASGRAQHTIQTKARSEVEGIEQRAQQLMLDAFAVEFETIVDAAQSRDELRTIGKELRALDGHLRLYDIELPPYSRFVKAIDAFLDDDTEGALYALERAAQEPMSVDLKRFVLYWLGYMLTTISAYDRAIKKFEGDEVDLARGDSQRIQLERMIKETSFFQIARRWIPAKDGGPRERLQKVARLLDELRDLAGEAATLDDPHHLSRISHEIARTRADIYTWVARDQNLPTKPLDDEWVGRAKQVACPAPQPPEDAAASGTVDELPTLDEPATLVALAPEQPEVLRAGALLLAESICREQEEPDFYIALAQAECEFALGRDGAETTYRGVERMLSDEGAKHREQRRTAELEACSLICHWRLLLLGSEAGHAEIRQANEAYRRAVKAEHDMRQPNVTVFSHVQRRNLTREEFKQEIKDIFDAVDRFQRTPGSSKSE